MARHPLPLTSDTLWSAPTPSDSFPAAATLCLSLRARSATLSPPGHARGREHLDRGHAAAHPHQHTHAPAGGAHVPIHPAPPRLGFGSFYCCPASLRAAWNSRRANNATCKPNNIENVIHQSYKFICCSLHALAPPSLSACLFPNCIPSQACSSLCEFNCTAAGPPMRYIAAVHPPSAILYMGVSGREVLGGSPSLWLLSPC